MVEPSMTDLLTIVNNILLEYGEYIRTINITDSLYFLVNFREITEYRLNQVYCTAFLYNLHAPAKQCSIL